METSYFFKNVMTFLVVIAIVSVYFVSAGGRPLLVGPEARTPLAILKSGTNWRLLSAVHLLPRDIGIITIITSLDMFRKHLNTHILCFTLSFLLRHFIH